jgi:hypothetical protein
MYTEKEPLQHNGSNRSLASSIEDIYFVESFEETTTGTSEAPYSPEETNSHPNTGANNNPNQNNNNNNNHTNHKPPTSTPPNNNYNSTHVAAPPTAAPKSLSEAHNNNDDDEDDFIKDMRAILNGEKKFESNKKMATPKAQQQSLNEDNDPRFQPVEAKNEHQIFDKIAQSMKFANAYDLGEFDIDQRLNDFDTLAEAKTKTSIGKAATAQTVLAMVQPTAQKATASAASNEDFILDLDDINNQAQAAQQTQTVTTDTPITPEVTYDI